MIERGQVISLTPSGAHLGAGQELSDLPQPQPFQKCSEPRRSWHKMKVYRIGSESTTRRNEKGRRPQEESTP